MDSKYKITEMTLKKGQCNHKKIVENIKNDKHNELLKECENMEKIEILYELGQLIKSIREEAKLTQKELADLLNTRQSEITRIENGKQNISIFKLYKIMKICNKKLNIKSFIIRKILKGDKEDYE